MKYERASGLALIGAAAAWILTMAYHPTGHDLLDPEHGVHQTHVAVATHALALAGIPCAFLGACGLTRWLRGTPLLGLAGLVLYGLSLSAVMQAAVQSGLVGTRIAVFLREAGPEERAVWVGASRLSHLINQGFAQVYVVASSLAIALWSLALLRRAGWVRALGAYGLPMALLLTATLVGGRLLLDVHGFGLVALAQALWLLGAGAALLSSSDSGGAASEA